MQAGQVVEVHLSAVGLYFTVVINGFSFCSTITKFINPRLCGDDPRLHVCVDFELVLPQFRFSVAQNSGVSLVLFFPGKRKRQNK